MKLSNVLTAFNQCKGSEKSNAALAKPYYIVWRIHLR